MNNECISQCCTRTLFKLINLASRILNKQYKPQNTCAYDQLTIQLLFKTLWPGPSSSFLLELFTTGGDVCIIKSLTTEQQPTLFYCLLLTTYQSFRAKVERDNHDLNKEKIKLESAEFRQTVLEALNCFMSLVGHGGYISLNSYPATVSLTLQLILVTG